MHDQQPTLTHALTCKSAFYDYLTTTIAFTALQIPLYRIYNKKNQKRLEPKNGYISMHIIGYKSRKSRDFVTVDSKLGLPVGLHSVSSRSSHAHTLTSCRLTCRRYLRLPLYLVDSLDLQLAVNLPRLRPVVDPAHLQLAVDLPRLRPVVDPPRPSTCC
jgi:hypothetical protein